MKAVVLLLPSLLVDRRVWTRVVPRLPETCTPCFADRPQLRTISDPAEAIAVCETDALEHIERQAQTGPIVVVGVSFGGYLGARVARASKHVRHVVAVSSVAAVPGELAEAYRQTADALERGDLDLSQFKAALIPPVAAEPERDRGMDQLLLEMLDDLDPATAVLNLRMTAALADPRLTIEPFDTPATVVHARDDRIVPLSSGEDLAARGGRASLVVVESSSHLLPLTHPTEIAEIVARAVESVRG
jgi:pimeloyl-ACP methyl ester carboxylesterase